MRVGRFSGHKNEPERGRRLADLADGGPPLGSDTAPSNGPFDPSDGPVTARCGQHPSAPPFRATLRDSSTIRLLPDLRPAFRHFAHPAWPGPHRKRINELSAQSVFSLRLSATSGVIPQ